ncbi:MAG: hypothetical protein H6811_04115 [Phycisphaeraceae bacterium]|nr:hypothetical protein [Phycisphaeraceae bacterium]
MRCRIGVIVLIGAAGLAGADVVSVPYATLTGDVTEGLELLDAGFGFEGANYDGVISNGLGLRMAERFAGQTVSDGTDKSGFGVFDVVTGAPTGPLSLAVGAPTENLVIGDSTPVGGPGHVISGLGSLGWPSFEAIGEGAIALLFDVNQFELGFTVFGESGPGDVFVSFYARDGSLLDEITLVEVIDAGYGFRTSDGAATIAGVLITNNEDLGISFDDFKYHRTPAPAGVVLLVAGAASRRRRR